MRLTWKDFALVACALSAGCSSSSSSGGASCGSFAACGGNIVGTWNIKNECFSSDYNPFQGCPGATLNLTSESLTGSITFNSDGTYTATDTGSANETLFIPSSCLSISVPDAGTFTETCAQLQTGLTTAPDGGTPNMANCTMTSTGCSCQVMTARSTSMGSGTYTAMGNTLTTTTGGGSGSVAYCVQGNTLTWQTMGVGGGTNTVVATK